VGPKERKGMDGLHGIVESLSKKRMNRPGFDGGSRV
jgi:hypothetical protein